MTRTLPFIFFFCLSISVRADIIVNRSLLLMGNSFNIAVVATDSANANHYIDVAVEEISRIEKLISSWDSTSQTSEIIRNAGIKPVPVSSELFDLIERSLTISKMTDGAFDISYASMDRIWKFDGSMHQMPSDSAIRASVSKVGYKNIILNKSDHSVFLKIKGMKIGFGAIGKGYAADKAKLLLQSMGVKSGIINASGDMNTWGVQPNGQTWKIAITNPLNHHAAFATLPVKDKAIVTSGDYEKFVMFDGIRYAHILDPKTGYPATGTISVSVLAPKAELADALATSIFVMGWEVGIDLINQLPDVECIVLDDKGNIYKSENIIIDKL